MSVAETRDAFSALARQIAWDQWSQMGVASAPPATPWSRAADPEALLLFTLEAGRDEPRLVDEALDWMLENDSLLSTHRLRGLCAGPQDRQLVDAAIAWMTAHKRGRSVDRPVGAGRDGSPTVPFFRTTVPVHDGRLDPAFAEHGLERPLLAPSGKSRSAELRHPISFALRLRRLVGVGVRAEVIRALLTIDAPRLETAVISRSAGFSDRNVREVLGQLVDAGFVEQVVVGAFRTFSIDKASWRALLVQGQRDDLPRHYDWPAALRALTSMLRWLSVPGLEGMSEYMQSSSARTMVEDVLPDLRYAGIWTVQGFPPGPIAWTSIDEFVLAAASQVLRGRR